MDQNLDNSNPVKPKKTLRNSIIWVVALVALTSLGIIWKNHTAAKKDVVSNRVIASKNIQLGTPSPENIDQLINLNLLKEDANNGNLISKEALELYMHRNAAEEFLTLGVPSPEKAPEALDLELLKADGDAGNETAKQQLALMTQRKLLLGNVKLGKEFPENLNEQLDIKLLKQDADAGNIEVNTALNLFENRTLAEKLCVLGKPFSLDFYEKVDREILQQDADAGYLTSKEILKIADNRINAEKHTILYQYYAKDFFKHVDKELLIADADAGNSDMQYIWALAHTQLIRPVDNALIKKYFSMSAAQNNPRGQYGLGCHLAYGEDGPNEMINEAFDLVKKSYEQGYTPSIITYVTMLGGPDHRGENEKFIIEALYKGAKAEDVYSMWAYGHRLIQGIGLEKDQVEGLKWLKKAIKAGSSDAMSTLADMLTNGSGGVEQNIAEAVNLHIRMAKYGNTISMNFLGEVYMNGMGNVKSDQKLAAKYINMYLEYNKKHRIGRDRRKQMGEPAHVYPQNLFNLAILYRDGKGVERNIEKAIELFLLALKDEHQDAHLALGDIYCNPDLGVQDGEKMIFYYTEGAKADHSVCLNRLGFLYLKGESVPKDTPLAVKYFLQGAKKNDSISLFNLGHIYGSGEYEDSGIKKDVKLAKEYYQKSLKAGYKPAEEAIKELDAE